MIIWAFRSLLPKCHLFVTGFLQNILKVPYYEKKVFSGVYMYKLSLPTPRIRKANKSFIVSAAHPLVKQCSYKCFCDFYLDTDWCETDWCYVAVLVAIYIIVSSPAALTCWGSDSWLLLLAWTGILLTHFLKDGESTVESGSISSTTYSATSLLTSQGSSIAEWENVFAAIILSLLSFTY